MWSKVIPSRITLLSIMSGNHRSSQQRTSTPILSSALKSQHKFYSQKQVVSVKPSQSHLDVEEDHCNLLIFLQAVGGKFAFERRAFWVDECCLNSYLAVGIEVLSIKVKSWSGATFPFVVITETSLICAVHS